MEDEIDRNIDDLGEAAKRLNMLAKATGDEIESQNKLIGRIADKVRSTKHHPLILMLTLRRAIVSTTAYIGRPRSSSEFAEHMFSLRALSAYWTLAKLSGPDFVVLESFC